MSENDAAPRGASFGDMPPDEFRRHAVEVIEWISTYFTEVGDLPVLAQVQPGEVRASLSEHPPAEPEPFDDIWRDFLTHILPGVTHWNHPGFHAYYAVTGSGPGVLGEMVASALNVNAMIWRSSPAGTELEELSTDWLRQLIGLPPAFRGVINDTASSSSLYALASAREAALPEAHEVGLARLPPARVYASEQAHSSVDKAVLTLGLGTRGVRKIPTDDHFRMDVGALEEAIEEDLEAGVRPVAIVATLGTTSTASMDPIVEIADVAEEHGLWVHVNAAYTGSAAICKEFRHHFEGWERADSIVTNPHKWLFTPIDCSVLFCRRPDVMRRAFSVTPEYLETAEQETTTSLMDYGISLGRRFRSLKLWFVMRYFGRSGIAARIREHCRIAKVFAEFIRTADAWEIAAPVHFGTVVYRFAPAGVGEDGANRLNLAIMDAVNASGEAFLSQTVLSGVVWLRMSVGNLRTTEAQVLRVWELLQEAASSAS
jgi:aromatic-L-amino-acid/L-tryptophan decarboxylase